MFGDNNKHESLNTWQSRLRRTYIYAFILITSSILVGAVTLQRALEEKASDAHIPNVAGAQRMLSQRVAALSFALSSQPDATYQDALRQQLRATIDRMRAGHEVLTGTNNAGHSLAAATQDLRDLYGNNGERLDARVAALIAKSEAWLAANIKGQQQLDTLGTADVFTTLLMDLDRAVSLHEIRVNAKLQGAQSIHRYSVVITLLVLSLEAVFVFWPLIKTAVGRFELYETELAERSELLSRAMRLARLGYWHVSDEKPGSIWISDELAHLYGLEEGGQNWIKLERLSELVYTEDLATIPAAAKMCRNTGKQESANTRIQCVDGTILDLFTLISPTLDSTGQVVAMTGVVVDVTEVVKAQNQLEEHSAKLAEAHTLGNVAMWRLEFGDKSIQLGRDAHALLRYDMEGPEGNTNFVDTPLKSICVGSSYEEIMTAKTLTIETGETQKIDVTLRRGDGTIADIAVRLKLERGDEGQPCALFGTIQDTSEQRSAQRQLEQLAYYDHLTGLANRALCTRQLKKACEQAQQLRITSALILIDLDNFKEINDGLGHQAGDEFLCEVGKRLAQIAGPNNVCSRLGGDEFAVIVTRVGDLLELDVMVSKMLAAITLPAKLAAGEASGSGSAGICIIPADTVASDEALQFADLALYEAKNSGRNQSSFFDPSMSKLMQSRLSLSRDLKGAIQANQLETHFQPIISSKTGKVSGFETLMRWNHPSKGWISPAEFIPVAESSHLIGHIGAFALQDACSHAKYWADRRNEEYEVSVNVSAAQLWHGDIEKVINKALEMSQLPAHLLCIELTESVFVGDSIDRVEGLLRRLKSRGIQLALDDFGTGYSSLGYLNNLPFDKLKIDRCFVSGVDISSERRRLLGGIVGLARGLDMEIVAEGVETAEELDAVLSMGCHYIQGFYYGKAQPAHMAIEIAETINQNARGFDAKAVRDALQVRAI